jgi:uncharacterized protein YegP (UPF0339 family)
MKQARYEVFETKSGRWGFRLRAANGRIVGPSQMYSRKSGAVRGIVAHSCAAFEACGEGWQWCPPRIVEVAK